MASLTAPIAEFVPEEIRSTIEEEIARFKSGEETIYTIFTGDRGPERRDPRPRRAVHDRRRTAQHGLVRRGRRGRDSQLDEVSVIGDRVTGLQASYDLSPSSGSIIASHLSPSSHPRSRCATSVSASGR